MRFTNENIRYCLLAWDPYEKAESDSYSSETLTISGLFNWAKALRGDRAFPRCAAEFDAYNIVHVNVTARNLFLIPHVLKQIDRSKTAILANVDFAVELWHQNFHYPESFVEYLDKCDYLFSVEPEAASVLSSILHRPVACIPHPSDTKGIAALHQEQRLQQIGVVAHRYSPNLLIPHMTLRDLPPGWQTVVSGMLDDFSPYFHLFTFAHPYARFDQYVQFIASLYAVIETHTMHTYGRQAVECAVLGVPVVGPSCVAAISRLFPDLVADSFLRTRTLLHALIEYPDFYLRCVTKAMSASSYYSLEKSAARMISFLNGEAFE